jgi:hypothetical protein
VRCRPEDLDVVLFAASRGLAKVVGPSHRVRDAPCFRLRDVFAAAARPVPLRARVAQPQRSAPVEKQLCEAAQLLLVLSKSVPEPAYGTCIRQTAVAVPFGALTGSSDSATSAGLTSIGGAISATQATCTRRGRSCGVADQARGRLGVAGRADDGASSGGSGAGQPWRPAPVGERGLLRPCAPVGFSSCWPPQRADPRRAVRRPSGAVARGAALV